MRDLGRFSVALILGGIPAALAAGEDGPASYFTMLPPRSATPAQSVPDRSQPQSASVAQCGPQSSTAARTSSPLASLQTIPQSASAIQEYSDCSPAAQSPRETDSSFHPLYDAPRETPARCSPYPRPD